MKQHSEKFGALLKVCVWMTDIYMSWSRKYKNTQLYKAVWQRFSLKWKATVQDYSKLKLLFFKSLTDSYFTVLFLANDFYPDDVFKLFCPIKSPTKRCLIYK